MKNTTWGALKNQRLLVDPPGTKPEDRDDFGIGVVKAMQAACEEYVAQHPDMKIMVTDSLGGGEAIIALLAASEPAVVPVLCVTSEQDTTIPPASVHEFAQALRAAQPDRPVAVTQMSGAHCQLLASDRHGGQAALHRRVGLWPTRAEVLDFMKRSPAYASYSPVAEPPPPGPPAIMAAQGGGYSPGKAEPRPCKEWCDALGQSTDLAIGYSRFTTFEKCVAQLVGSSSATFPCWLLLSTLMSCVSIGIAILRTFRI